MAYLVPSEFVTKMVDAGESKILMSTRDTLVRERRMTPWWQRVGFRLLGRHRLLLAGSTLLALAQRAHLVPKRLNLPRLPIRRPPAMQATGSDVWLFTGEKPRRTEANGLRR